MREYVLEEFSNPQPPFLQPHRPEGFSHREAALIRDRDLKDQQTFLESPLTFFNRNRDVPFRD